ncbi:MAG TPA: hypothetical protein VFG68_19490 [Fimbriiglobus sp.]|nr:hypothetical protein [Fimbriiglobus sp.]
MERIINCPGCGVSGKLPANHPSGQISCPQCKTVFAIPASGGADTVSTPTQVRPIDDRFAVWVGNPGEQPLRPAVGVSGPVPDDAAAHLEWVRAESHQFDQYVATRLAALDRRRQEMAALESRLESEFTTREQELNRQRASLTARTEALAGREEEFARREGEFAQTLAGLTGREKAVAAREAKLTAHKLKVVELERREKQLWPVVEALERRKEEAEHLLARLAELDKRQAQLDREGQALARRVAELDELEQDLRSELEEREREVEERRRLLEMRERQVRAAATVDQTPAPVETPPVAFRHFLKPADKTS